MKWEKCWCWSDHDSGGTGRRAAGSLLEIVLIDRLCEIRCFFDKSIPLLLGLWWMSHVVVE